jgi:E3 ubiquitin-protein ligase ZSWIM2
LGFYNVHIHIYIYIYIFDTILNYQKNAKKVKFLPILVSWQLGLVDRELNEVLHGQPNKQPPKTPARRWATSGSASSTTADSRPTIRQKDITDDDCCPICQDELLNKHIPVTFCKYVSIL